MSRGTPMPVAHLLQRYYFSRPNFVDGTTEFHAMLSRYIPGGAAILEIGCGEANPTTRFLASIGAVRGLETTVPQHNPYVQDCIAYDGERFPLPSDSVDACVANYVLEHVRNPCAMFAEISRVLRPGGVFCFRTPNLWHFLPLASALLPYWLHRCLLSGRDAYRTYYRANSERALRSLCHQAGLVPIELRMVEKEPGYARGSLLFYAMMWYERLVNATPLLATFRVNLFGCVRRTACGHASPDPSRGIHK